MTKEIDKFNLIHLSGQVYSDPEEKTGKNRNSPGEWKIRKIKIIFNNSQWIDLIFEDVELWAKFKNLRIGYYIEVEGKLRNYFNRISKSSKAQLEVINVLWTQPIITTDKSKFIMTKETITSRKQKRSITDGTKKI